MSLSIPGVDPELTKLTNAEEVSSYIQNKVLSEHHDPADFNVKQLKKWLIHYHNKYRAHHRSPAVSSDNSLNILAQKWADELAHHKQRLVHEKPSNYGENLTYFASSQFPSPEVLAAALIHGFYTEGYQYDYTRFTPGAWAANGHFTQLIWKSSRKIGLGVTLVKRGSMHQVYVCIKYDPPGNLQTSEEYLSNIKAPRKRECRCTIN